ncbi:hypothetical protein GS429_05725 [Natronorubrum sp. JWXQ-INN-674]|uniref:Uncharacterized protein n=1 Tax=Natronorubrum halalkaliphilum TaxID=2691917 RepID=A0A6B0VI87_9EURY|nr:hypothetical protein [Natronorubrum halalkaliphilum]MXV61571.1 hypothetical protein [Natronorubrum halalkaliphilum]
MDLDIVDDLKQPEYTGDNRCEPCTILNLAIAVVAGSIIARKSKLGGLIAVGVSIALIYLRGYLVPGTPTLTKRYLPPEVLRWFGKEPDPELASGLGAVDSASAAATDGSESETGSSAADRTEVATYDEEAAVEAGEEAGSGTGTAEVAESEGQEQGQEPERDELDLETYFLDHDVLEPCADRDDLCLTDAFEDAWFEEIEALDASTIDAADAVDAFGFDADPDAFDLESRDDATLLRSDRGVAGRWPSQAAILADITASRTLENWTPDPQWNVHEPETKGQVLNGLRMFLETCPTGGEVSMGEEVVESCCSSHEVVAVTCDETGERLFEQRVNTSTKRMQR